MEFYNQSRKETLSALESKEKLGLSQEESKLRLKKYGPNLIEVKKKINPLIIFFKQFKSFIIYILLFAVAISFLTKEYVDASVISAILVFNALFGFIQEFRAEKSIEALKKLSALKANILRNGKIEKIDAKFLVPGDIIILEEGDKIPADARILSQKNLQISEASLTGESLPVSKTERELSGNLGIADRKNLVFSSTLITRGRATAIVTGTGTHTEIGKIATLISQVKKELTPLQKKLDSFGKWIGGGVIGISIIIFIIGILKDNLFSLLTSSQYTEFLLQSKEWFLTSIALAVAAVPEGLPAIVTISLAVGVRKMLKRKTLIRRLPSIETLGSTSVICSDKTGTLTKNEMTVQKAFVNSKILDVTGSGFSLNGKIQGKITEKDLLLFKIGALCNNAGFEKKSGLSKVHKMRGDPTELALLISAAKAKIENIKEWKRIDELPFDSIRKMMSVLCKDPKTKKNFVFTKGAPEIVIEKCTRILINGRIQTLNSKTKKKILLQNEIFAKQALRVLGFAYKENKSEKAGEKTESNLIFVGLQGMIDPPRLQVKESIQKCKDAGIRVIMVTGDNQYTAQAIANQIGIGGKSLNGVGFSNLSLQKKQKAIQEISIFARVEPRHKLEIIKLLQKQGYVCAMTGDGVNDAPALKKSDIGIAMGIKGTDVAKESSDMILQDDNFSSIVNSVEEGRGIYDNINKFINYLLSSNLAEVLVIFLAIIFGFPLPMTAIMLLWINLVTDGFPALALSADPYSKGIMKRKPKNSEKQIIGKSALFNIVYVAVLITIAVLGLFYWAQQSSFALEKMQTIAFTAIIVMEFARIYVIRSEYDLGIFSNKWLILAILVSLLLQLAVIYTPLSSFFGTVPLNTTDWTAIIGATIAVFILSFAGTKIRKKFGWFED
jgi:P-type Ca2+ transporter type 2C